MNFQAMNGVRILSVLAGLILASSPARAGTILITEQEASLPGEEFAVGSRGITRGPLVELVEPGETAHSPTHFRLRFQAFGGSKINLDSLRVDYLKKPEVDLVPRLMRFAQRSGIDVPDAEIPTGEHYFRVEVTDTEGRTKSMVFSFTVLP